MKTLDHYEITDGWINLYFITDSPEYEVETYDLDKCELWLKRNGFMQGSSDTWDFDRDCAFTNEWKCNDFREFEERFSYEYRLAALDSWVKDMEEKRKIHLKNKAA